MRAAAACAILRACDPAAAASSAASSAGASCASSLPPSYRPTLSPSSSPTSSLPTAASLAHSVRDSRLRRSSIEHDRRRAASRLQRQRVVANLLIA